MSLDKQRLVRKLRCLHGQSGFSVRSSIGIFHCVCVGVSISACVCSGGQDHLLGKSFEGIIELSRVVKGNYSGFSVCFLSQPLTGRWPTDGLLFECVERGAVEVVLGVERLESELRPAGLGEEMKRKMPEDTAGEEKVCS